MYIAEVPGTGSIKILSKLKLPLCLVLPMVYFNSNHGSYLLVSSWIAFDRLCPVRCYPLVENVHTKCPRSQLASSFLLADEHAH